MNDDSSKTNIILIVDDNPTNLQLLFDFLDSAGFSVLVAETGEGALKQINYIRPDIILLDIMMPGINGFETCRRLKSQAETKDIPVIFMSAMAETESKVKGFEVGAIDYITKPFQYREILARVTTHLTIQELQNSLHQQNDQLQQEIGERKRIEEELFYRAFHDALTDLPNRTLFINYLERSIERHEEDDHYLFAVLFLDLDRFKLINDSLGHLIGDQLLITIARRLEENVRSNDVVARLGGDEFVILLDGIQNIHEAQSIANHIQHSLALPINLNTKDRGEHQIFTTASIGITASTRNYKLPEDILRDADTAMYQAKDKGKARYELFESGQYTRAVTRLRLEADLWQALNRQEFILYYQPIVSLSSGRISGVEALLRWLHPRQGLIMPEKFIYMAEETGLIVSIGEWMLRTACAQTKNWHEAGYDFLRLAVNISSRQFQQQNLPTLIEDVLQETGLAPQMLELEITGSITLIDNEQNLSDLKKLRVMGVGISIDDFGLGSSLEYLKLLPLDTLKIDPSFIHDLMTKTAHPRKGDDVTIVTAIISMAHSLNLKVIAEGVETEAQLTFLRQQHCNEIQGYLVSQPVLAETFTQLLPREQFIPPQFSDEELDLLVRTETVQRQKIAYVLADEQLTIVANNAAVRQWVDGEFDTLVGQFLPHVFPELIGVEDVLHQLAHNQVQTFTIPRIYRSAADDFGRYFDLQIEPFLAVGVSLLVMAIDITAEAHLEFELRQERNKLRLSVMKYLQTQESS